MVVFSNKVTSRLYCQIYANIANYPQFQLFYTKKLEKYDLRNRLQKRGRASRHVPAGNFY